MVFTEARFFVFFVLAFGVHWALRSHGLRKVWLLACSYVFYGAWDWRFLSLLVGSTVLDYFVGLRLEGSRSVTTRRRWMTASLVFNLGLLGVFKYYNFFADSAARLLQSFGLGAHVWTLGIVLPVGISFYTFQSLSYTIDVYRRELRATRSLVDFALFVAFFPQLVAGPIVRAADFLPQLEHRKRFLDIDMRPHVALILAGFLKKACIADNLAAVADPVFADPAAWSTGSHWLALVLYTIQFYCDFSGYTDIALGCAGVFGYRLTLNFNFPYLATSMTEFWRRWHISLSTWFRDYLYVPLGGNRHGPARTARNLFVVFLLCGLWHGAAWTFVVFGLYHGALLTIERLLFGERRVRGLPGMQVYVLFAWAISLVFFRSPTLGAALGYLGDLFGGAAGGSAIAPQWWLFVALAATLHLAARRGLVTRVARMPSLPYAVGCGVVIALLFSFASADYKPFIYFQF